MIDLFDQTLLFVCYLLSFSLLGVGFSRLFKPYKGHVRSRLLILWVTIGALGASATCWYGVQLYFPTDNIPVESIIWVLPFFYGLGLAVVGIRKIAIVGLGLSAAIVSLGLVALIVNQYYHYYPTLDALLKTSKTITIADKASTDTASFKSPQTVLEQYYQALPGQSTHGQLTSLSVPSSNKDFLPRQGRIYLPPAAQGNSQIKLPVIVLLAGYPGNPVHWEQAGLLAMMDEFSAKHKGLAPIIAVVDFTGEKDVDTECVDSKLGSSESYLTKDVPAYLKAHYPVQTDISDWTIGGYSAGGTCGSLIAIRNPAVYHNFLNISGDTAPGLRNQAETLAVLFGGSTEQLLAHTPNELLKAGNPLYKGMNGWYFYGNQDNQLVMARIKQQAQLAKQAGMTVMTAETDGHHSFTVWKQGYIEGLPWISHQMGLTTNETH